MFVLRSEQQLVTTAAKFAWKHITAALRLLNQQVPALWFEFYKLLNANTEHQTAHLAGWEHGFVHKTCSPRTARCKGGWERTNWAGSADTGNTAPVLSGYGACPPPLCTFPKPSTHLLGDGNTFLSGFF